jgi:hypothetical protein
MFHEFIQTEWNAVRQLEAEVWGVVLVVFLFGN